MSADAKAELGLVPSPSCPACGGSLAVRRSKGSCPRCVRQYRVVVSRPPAASGAYREASFTELVELDRRLRVPRTRKLVLHPTADGDLDLAVGDVPGLWTGSEPRSPASVILALLLAVASPLIFGATGHLILAWLASLGPVLYVLNWFRVGEAEQIAYRSEHDLLRIAGGQLSVDRVRLGRHFPKARALSEIA